MSALDLRTVIAIVIVILVIYFLAYRRERFVSSKDEAERVVDWMKTSPNHTMTSFKNIIGSSNMDVLDLERAKALKSSGKLTADALVSQ